MYKILIFNKPAGGDIITADNFGATANKEPPRIHISRVFLRIEMQ